MIKVFDSNSEIYYKLGNFENEKSFIKILNDEFKNLSDELILILFQGRPHLIPHRKFKILKLDGSRDINPDETSGTKLNSLGLPVAKLKNGINGKIIMRIGRDNNDNSLVFSQYNKEKLDPNNVIDFIVNLKELMNKK
ncbi:MAG: hypothetical protein ACLFPL_01155 [Candidatus Nanoarchaeia archaeon]